ncbi:MAG TPA: hypothetical protein VF275_13065, partial [Gammaproteobacteria bacterium]
MLRRGCLRAFAALDFRDPLSSPQVYPNDAAGGSTPAPRISNKEIAMKHELPELPYALDALAPHVSRETL